MEIETNETIEEKADGVFEDFRIEMNQEKLQVIKEIEKRKKNKGTRLLRHLGIK